MLTTRDPHRTTRTAGASCKREGEPLNHNRRNTCLPVLFIAGSRRFALHIQNVYKMCRAAGITTILGRAPDRLSPLYEDDTVDILHRIDQTDIVYVLAISGYVGRTVAAEVVYAHSQGKVILSSELIHNSDVNARVTKIIPPGKLIAFIKTTAYDTIMKRVA